MINTIIRPLVDGFQKHVVDFPTTAACLVTGWLALIAGTSAGQRTHVRPLTALSNVTDWFGWHGGTGWIADLSAWLQDPARATVLGLVATWFVPLLLARWDADRIGDQRSLGAGSFAWVIWLGVAEGVGYGSAIRALLPLVGLWATLSLGYWVFVQVAAQLDFHFDGPIKQWPMCFWSVLLTPILVFVVPALLAMYVFLLPTPWSPLGLRPTG